MVKVLNMFYTDRQDGRFGRRRCASASYRAAPANGLHVEHLTQKRALSFAWSSLTTRAHHGEICWSPKVAA